MASYKTRQVNVESFRKLLIKAIGGSSLRSFSRRAGIATSTLSLYLHSDSFTPHPSTIRKIASASLGTIEPIELYEAAGYGLDSFDYLYEFSCDSQNNILPNNHMVNNVIATIQNSLNYSYSIEYSKPEYIDSDLHIHFDDTSSPIDEWHIKFFPYDKTISQREMVYKMLEHIDSHFHKQFFGNAKISVVTDDLPTFYALQQCDGLPNIPTSVIFSFPDIETDAIEYNLHSKPYPNDILINPSYRNFTLTPLDDI